MLAIQLAVSNNPFVISLRPNRNEAAAVVKCDWPAADSGWGGAAQGQHVHGREELQPLCAAH